MKRNTQITKSIAVTIALFTIVVSGCVSEQKSREEYAAIKKAQNEETARNAEAIPPQLAAEAATTFSDGKPFFIWRAGEGVIIHPPTRSIKIRYAIAPNIQVQDLPIPGASMRFMGPGGTHFSSGAGTTLDFGMLKGHGQLEVYFSDARSLGPSKPISNILRVEVENR